MQDSVTMLCCGAVFGVLAVVVLLALLKKRGPVTVRPSSSVPKTPSKSVEGKHLANTKTVEGKHRVETKSVEGKHLAEKEPVRSKRLIEPPRSKNVSKRHVERTGSKSEYHAAKPEGERSKSTYKQADATRDDDANPQLRKD